MPEMSAEDFVALVLAAPIQEGRAEYGYSLRVESGERRRPGVLAVTWITGRNEGERALIRDHSRRTVAQFVEEPGFISIVTGFIGLRGFTVTAWLDEPSMERALSGHHALAMRELFHDGIVASVWTSVWNPIRLNTLWVRCTSCDALQDGASESATCTECGAALPPQPAYW